MNVINDGKKKILIVCNVKTLNNPALSTIIRDLNEKYNLHISGSQNIKAKFYGDVSYKVHSKIYDLLIRFRILQLFSYIYIVLFKSTYSSTDSARNHFILKSKLFISSFEFIFTTPKSDFIIHIDTEAAIITKLYRDYYKINSGILIFEFYADQFQQIKDKYYNCKVGIERKSFVNASFILSGCNYVVGQYIINRYKIETECISYTILPKKAYNEEIEVSKVIKFYYHGMFFPNRGLEEAILAMKNITGGKLFLRGMGDFSKQLNDLIIEHALQNKVVILPAISTDNLAISAAEFDIGLTLVRMNVLNHKYAIGFKTFENISAGLALILPASVPLTLMNEKYNVGMLYEDATIENLTFMFQYCINNRDKISMWKRNARIAYKEEYNPEIQSARLVKAIANYI